MERKRRSRIPGIGTSTFPVSASAGSTRSRIICTPGTFSASLSPAEALTLVLSTESSPALDGEQAWERRAQHEEGLVAAWKRARPEARTAPDWIKHLVLASDQFVAKRPTPAHPDGLAGISG